MDFSAEIRSLERKASQLRKYIFFFLTPSPTVIYTLSLHDALPICLDRRSQLGHEVRRGRVAHPAGAGRARSEEHTSELQSVEISYAVFCLKKKIRQPNPLSEGDHGPPS